jgi:hypothetical protein
MRALYRTLPSGVTFRWILTGPALLGSPQAKP